MEFDRATTCCFTGHRPSALPWKYNEKGVDFVMFRHRLRVAVEKAIERGYTRFITGMAQGVDLIAAEVVLDFKRENPSIILECAVPCKNQQADWNEENKIRYNEILRVADRVTFITDQDYTEGCMKKRNEYMIENSSLVIAGFNGKVGGTKQTISLARKKGVEVITIKP